MDEDKAEKEKLTNIDKHCDSIFNGADDDRRNIGKGAMKREESEKNTLLYQMECKYFNQVEQNSGDQEQPYFIDIFGHSPCEAAHEQLLELLVLDNLGICRIGCLSRLSSLAKRVAELDLSWNHLDWPCVGQLIQALPQLQTLNLSCNPGLGQCLTKQLPPHQKFPMAKKLETLILNGIPVFVPTLRAILQNAPCLRELHLSGADFPDLPEPHSADAKTIEAIPCRLDEVHLNKCGFRDWCQVMAILQFFPQLESLFLVDNPLTTVQLECPQCGCNGSARANYAMLTSRIRVLSMSNTEIASWEAIENLSAMEQLEELRVAHIPLLEKYSPEERRHLVIGRLQALKILNGSAIDARQREESERFFIRYYAVAEKKPPIYEQLVARHGALEQLVKVDLTPKQFAKVSIHCEETDWVRMWIRLRLSGTVQQLMKFAERITNIPMRLMRIFYVDKDLRVLGPVELRFPNQQLKMLHIEDGDEFFVQSKPTRMAAPPGNGTNRTDNACQQSPTKQRISAHLMGR